MAEKIQSDLSSREEAQTVDVWPENHEAVNTFLRCMTQWRMAFGGVVGLDYTAVEAVMRITGVEDHIDCLDRLRVMEAEALRQFSSS